MRQSCQSGLVKAAHMGLMLLPQQWLPRPAAAVRMSPEVRAFCSFSYEPHGSAEQGRAVSEWHTTPQVIVLYVLLWMVISARTD